MGSEPENDISTNIYIYIYISKNKVRPKFVHRHSWAYDIVHTELFAGVCTVGSSAAQVAP